MKVILNEISKRFTTQWILKKVNFTFLSGNVYGVRGYNGSGKSTLMKIISTQLPPTLGQVTYFSDDEKEYNVDTAKNLISFAAPYITPFENLSLKEQFNFHSTFRSFRDGINYEVFKDLLKYDFKDHQLIKNYSSGMKQRLSLALTVLSKSEVVLLDEPTSFLDVNAKDWFYNLLEKESDKKTIIISSNDSLDLKNCKEFIDL